MLRLELIQSFVTVAKTQSITYSAEILYLAQSTVSHHLKLLEEEVGGQLIERQKGKKTTRLTERGEAFLPIAEKWIALWQETESFKQGEETKSLNIGCVNSLLTCLLRDFFAGLIEKYPDICFQFISLNSEEMYDMVRTKKIDVGIVLSNITNQNIRIHPLLAEKMFCVCSNDVNIPQASLSPDMLDPRKEILMNWGIEYELWHDYWFKGKGIPKFTINTILLLEDALKSGGTWAVVPDSVKNYLIQRGVCKSYELQSAPSPRTSYVITNEIPELQKKEVIALFDRELMEWIDRSPYKFF